MVNDDVEIVLTPNPRSRGLCHFIVNIDGWKSFVKFPSQREWAHNLFLRLVYNLGKLKRVSYGTERLYPPDICFAYPRNKVGMLNALRYVKAKDREKLTELFESGDVEKFEGEVLALGIAESLKK